MYVNVCVYDIVNDVIYDVDIINRLDCTDVIDRPSLRIQRGGGNFKCTFPNYFELFPTLIYLQGI